LKSGSVKDAVSCDACNLSFKSGSFDVVTSFGVFHHMPTRKDRLKFLREVSRVLVDGGIGIIRFGFLLGVNDEDVKVKWAGDVNRYYHSISYDELLALVQKIVESGNFNSYNISSSEFSHKEVLVKGTHSVYRSRFGNYLVILRK
jgi:ubiquinone/menaquinone biosynthesis C-methylase UbiE